MANNLLESKLEIFEIWKNLDQFNLLMKIILNKNQCYMLKNRGLKVLTNKMEKDKEIENLKDLK